MSFYFKDLCLLFDSVKQTKGANEKAKTVTEYFQKVRAHTTSETIFSVIRLILPKLDRERESYNMKESKISKVIIKMLALPAGNDKNVLSKSYLMSGQATDFGDVVYSVIRKYISNYSSVLTIKELNSYLDDMSKRKSESEAEEILIKIMRSLSPEDMRWIIRIILKDLKLGIDGNRILNCYHRDGAAYYATNNSLKKVCEILWDKNVNLHELEIEIFEACRPMLSKRVDAATFKNFQENRLYYIENKFDGERFQLHMENNVFKYFSRNGFDYTSTFGKTYETGIFTPKLKSLFYPNITKIILDGEMMLWNKKTKKYGSKGMSLDVKKLNSDGVYQPCFCCYDIILLNDNILTNKPLKERIRILRNIFASVRPGTITLSNIKQVHTRLEIVNELNMSVEKEEEGIIVKDPDSIYKFDDRNSGWFKMKLEYFQDVMNDLDLILMGGCYASSTSDKLNSFIVGVRSGSTENGKPIYLSFGKVSTGLNYEELEMLDKKLKTQGHLFSNFKSDSLMFGKEVPNYYINPEYSVIFEVRATELIRTTDSSYKTSYTLRFPRVLKIRDDKRVDECLNINELLELSNKNNHVIKLNKRNIELEEILQTKTKKLKRRKLIIPTFVDTTQISDLLEGYTIHIFNGNEKYSKEDAENIIKKAGGKVSYKIDDTTDIVIVGVSTTKVKEITSKRNKYDVIGIEWLQRIIQDGNLLGYETEEIFGLGYSYKNCLSDELDMYGDSLTKNATVESLKHCFNIINNLKESFNTNTTVGFNKIPCFDKFVAYFDKYDVINDTKSNILYESFLDELEFQYYNGTVSKTITEKVNLVIFNGSENRLIFLKDQLKNICKNDIEIVTRNFIYQKT